jgi:hypothetical protein
MSERGAHFLQDWIDEHLPGGLPVDKATARTLTTRAALDARHSGLEISEIEEELGSMEQVIFEALDSPDI